MAGIPMDAQKERKMIAPIINATDVSVSYGTTSVLEHVDFQCGHGEFTAIVGRSGTGKSSFLNALAGFIPFEGEIRAPEKLGYVSQNHALFPWLTVRGNIGFGLEGMNSAERQRRIEEMLKKIEMEELGARYPGELSGGQIQRVALARALAPDPDAVLMDEPYAALDHHTRDRMQDWLLNIWRESAKTVLFVTHYIEEAIYLSDRIIVVREKKFVADLKVPFLRPRKSDLRFTERFLDLKHEVLDFMEDDA